MFCFVFLAALAFLFGLRLVGMFVNSVDVMRLLVLEFTRLLYYVLAVFLVVELCLLVFVTCVGIDLWRVSWFMDLVVGFVGFWLFLVASRADCWVPFGWGFWWLCTGRCAFCWWFVGS